MKNNKLYLPIILLLSGASMYAGEVVTTAAIPAKLNPEIKLLLSKELSKKFNNDKDTAAKLKDKTLLKKLTTEQRTEIEKADGTVVGKDALDQVSTDKYSDVIESTSAKQVVPLTMKDEVKDSQPQATTPANALLTSFYYTNQVKQGTYLMESLEAQEEALKKQKEQAQKKLQSDIDQLNHRIATLQAAMTGKGATIVSNEGKIKKIRDKNEELQAQLDADAKKLTEHNTFLRSLTSGQIKSTTVAVAAAIVEAQPQSIEVATVPTELPAQVQQEIAAPTEVAAPAEIKQEAIVVIPEVKKEESKKATTWSMNPFSWGSKSTKETPKAETIKQEIAKAIETPIKPETPKTSTKEAKPAAEAKK